MTEEDRVEYMKKEEENKEDIQDIKEEEKKEDNPKPVKKKSAKKKAVKKTEEQKEEKKGEEKKEEDKEEKKEAEDEPKKTKKNYFKIITTVVVLLAIIALILFIANIDMFFPGEPKQEGEQIAAVVNGEEITQEELSKQYAVLPAQYKMTITEEAFLEQMIDEKLLLQEASEHDIKVDDERVDSIVEGIIEQSGLSEEEFEERLELQGISLDYIMDYYRNQIRISDLLNKTIFSETEATFPERVKASHILVEDIETAEEVKEKLEEGESFAEIALEYSIDTASAQDGGNLGYFSEGQMVEDFEEAAFELDIGEISDIVESDFGYHIIKVADKKDEQQVLMSDVRVDEQRMISDQMSSAITGYLEGLRDEAEIIIREDKEPGGIETFKVTEDEICTEDGKPIVRLYTTTNCPHCSWISDTFDETMKEYEDQIAAYHWQLDTGDNTLTEKTEEAIPKSEIAVFQQYNPKNSVPTFIFGCKYYRVGNAYESAGGLSSEKAEFEAVIGELLGEE